MGDFTNLAAVGQKLGWMPTFYGPQSALEQITSLELVTASGEQVVVPGYFTLRRAKYPRSRSFLGRSVASWYGRAIEGGQRWASFKMLVQFKRPLSNTAASYGSPEDGFACCDSSTMRHIQGSGAVVLAPSWPLSA